MPIRIIRAVLLAGATTWLCLAVLGSMVGCGGSSSSTTSGPMAAMPISPEVAALPIVLGAAPSGASGANIQGQLNAALAAAGYRLSGNPAEPGAVSVQLVVNATPRQSFLKATINGVRQVTYDVRASVQLTGQGRVIDQVATVFESDQTGAVPGDVGNKFVIALNSSPGLRGYASAVANQKIAAQRAAQLEQQRQAELAAEQARREQEEAWIEANSGACAAPATLKACEGVQLYLAHYPMGPHAQEAAQVLEQARPGLEKLLKDEDYWDTKTDWRTCKRSPSKDSCVGVELYRTKYPAGLHAEHAGQLLDALREARP